MAPRQNNTVSRDKNKVISFGYLLPAYLIFASLILIARRDFSQALQSPIELTNIHKIVAIVVTIITIFAYLSMKGVPRKWTKVQKYYFGYIVIGIAGSVLHSPNLLYSLWKLTEISAVFLLSIYLLRVYRFKPEIIRSYYNLNLNYFKFMFAITLVGAIVYPSRAIISPLSEQSIKTFGTPILPFQIFGVIVEINPNTLGIMASILLYVHFTRVLCGENSVKNYIWTTMAGIMLIFAQSRTAWIGLIIAATISIIFLARIGKVKKLLLYILVVPVGWMFSSTFYSYFTKGISLDLLYNLTGRIVWWVTAVKEFFYVGIMKQLLGLGFMAGNRTILSNKLDAAGSASLHSDYIDALISTGILGAVFMTLGIFYLIIESVKTLRSTRYSTPAIELVGIAIILIVRSLTGTTFASHNHFLPLYFAITLGCLNLSINEGNLGGYRKCSFIKGKHARIEK